MWTKTWRSAAVVLSMTLAAAWMGCGGPEADDPASLGDDSTLAPPQGPGGYDAGKADPRDPDAGLPGGEADAGTDDAGVIDPGSPDAGEEDAGVVDPGLPDAGGDDAGVADAGTPDAGQPALCSTCHGSSTNAAPPRDTTGGTATSLRTVGAHQSHLRASNWHAQVACSACHVVPASPTSPGHIDAAPAELTFSSLATANGSFSAAWNGTTCAVYCHGSSLNAGGANTAPTWTVVDGTQAACGSCHALPPTGGHPNQTNCSGCHPQVMNSDNVTFKNPSLHINGAVDRQ